MFAFTLAFLILGLASVGVTVIVGYAIFRLVYAMYQKIREDMK